MKERTKTGLKILQTALILGVAGDILLRITPWGLNVLLFNLAFVGGTVMLLRSRFPERLTGQTYALLGALIYFASMFVWRDAIELRVADTFAIIAILGLVFLPTLKVSPKLAGASHYVVSAVWAGVNAVFAPFALLASDIGWTELQMTGWRKHAFAVFRSVLVATPLILIFGTLFMAADAVYEGWVQRMLNIDFETVFSHGALFAVFAWLSAGYLRGAILGGVDFADEGVLSVIAPETPKRGESPVARMRADSGEYPVVLPDNKTVVEHINTSDAPNMNAPKPETEAATGDGSNAGATATAPKNTWTWANFDNSIVPGFTLGSVEIGVILGLVNLLFLSFVIFQVPYLFGGMDLVQNTPDFKLADYARRGFGELVAVSALVLPLLLATHWLIKKDAPLAGKIFKVFAGVQIGLLFVIMASAVQRLVLLTGNLGYGMTTVRLYPLIFMLWLAVVFVWFGVTVLRKARSQFAWGAIWAAFVVLGATHVLNPDAFIVRTNIALMQQGREFDAAYNSQLSDDALPVLLGSFEQLSSVDQQIAVRNLATRACEMSEERDLRSWNFARWNASRALLSNEAFLLEIGDCSKHKYYSRGHDDF